VEAWSGAASVSGGCKFFIFPTRNQTFIFHLVSRSKISPAFTLPGDEDGKNGSQHIKDEKKSIFFGES
jgi:hypothetical protein